MPAIIAALMEGLAWLFKSQLGRWIVSAFLFLGISFGTSHFIITPSLEYVRSLAANAGSGGPLAATMISWAGVLQFDKAISMILAAVATKMGVGAGKLFLQRRT